MELATVLVEIFFLEWSSVAIVTYTAGARRSPQQKAEAWSKL